MNAAQTRATTDERFQTTVKSAKATAFLWLHVSHASLNLLTQNIPENGHNTCLINCLNQDVT